jgi:hypothetical protein
MSRLQALSARLLGPAPDRSAPKVERLMWLRRVYIRMLPFNLAAYAVVVATSGLWDIASILIGITVVIWLLGRLWLAVQIRRLRDSDAA